MKVFVTGSLNGQLYWELSRTVPATTTWLSLPERLDITDKQAVSEAIGFLKPDVIINTAAYTSVDQAETDKEQAALVNTDAVGALCQAAQAHRARLIHISTDFVFGLGDGRPFTTDAPVSPASVYGKTKLAGEHLILQQLPQSGLIIRTAWVYSSNGKNFVKTMLRLMNERGEVGVIADQIGSPTWAKALANAIWRAVDTQATGIMHWTGAGVASWYDFAIAISEEGVELGLLDSPATVNPLTTEQYPTPAERPPYSVLSLSSTFDQLELQANHWREDLRSMLKELT